MNSHVSGQTAQYGHLYFWVNSPCIRIAPALKNFSKSHTHLVLENFSLFSPLFPFLPFPLLPSFYSIIPIAHEYFALFCSKNATWNLWCKHPMSASFPFTLWIKCVAYNTHCLQILSVSLPRTLPNETLRHIIDSFNGTLPQTRSTSLERGGPQKNCPDCFDWQEKDHPNCLRNIQIAI